MKLLRRIVLIALLIPMSTAAYAGYNLDLGDFGTQATFDSFVEEVGGLVAYRAMAPAEPGGLTGFDISVAASAVKIDSDLWTLVTTGSSYSSDYLVVPSLRVRKGLPLNIDVGVSYTGLSGSDISLLGAELQWAILEGSVATPAVALRGHYSQLLGVDDLDMQAYGADLLVSKGFAMFTPYVGVGAVYAKGEYTGTFAQTVTLESHDFTSARYFGGVRIALALLQITADVEYTEQPVYSLKVGLGW
jgi:opacity protein-like surface antigen